MNIPNKLSILRILMIPIFMVFILPVSENFPGAPAINDFIASTGHYIAVILFIIAASTDAIDGYIARKYDMVTTMGKFLDPIADKLLVVAALISLVQFNMISAWTALIIVSREFIVTGLRVIAASEGIVIAASKWGKVKTIVQIIAVVMALLVNYPFSLFTNINIYKYVMFVAVIITIYSGYDYIHKNRDVLLKGGI